MTALRAASYHREIADRNIEAILDAAEELLELQGHATISAVLMRPQGQSVRGCTWHCVRAGSLSGLGTPDPESVSQRVCEMGELDRSVVDEGDDHSRAKLLCPLDRGAH